MMLDNVIMQRISVFNYAQTSAFAKSRSRLMLFSKTSSRIISASLCLFLNHKMFLNHSFSIIQFKRAQIKTFTPRVSKISLHFN